MALGQELTTPTPALARPANSQKIPPTPPHVPPRVQASPSPLDAVRARGSPGGIPEARQSGRAPGNTRTDFNPPQKLGDRPPPRLRGSRWRHPPRLGRAKPSASASCPDGERTKEGQGTGTAPPAAR